MERMVEEFTQDRVGKALERLRELKPGEQISFVGLRALAEELVKEAESEGLKIQAELQEGFNQHFLTLLEKVDLQLAHEGPQKVTGIVQFFRVILVSLLAKLPTRKKS